MWLILCAYIATTDISEPIIARIWQGFTQFMISWFCVTPGHLRSSNKKKVTKPQICPSNLVFNHNTIYTEWFKPVWALVSALLFVLYGYMLFVSPPGHYGCPKRFLCTYLSWINKSWEICWWLVLTPFRITKKLVTL